MRKIAQIITEKPILVLVGLLLITIVFGLGLPKLEVKNNQDSELPANDEIVKTNDHLNEIFGKKDVLLIGVESDDIFNATTLNKIQKISEELRSVEGVSEEEITSISTINNIQGKDWGLDVGAFMEESPTDANEIQLLKKNALSNELIAGKLVAKDATFTAIIANLQEEYDQTKVFLAVEEIIAQYKGDENFYLAGDPINQHEIDAGIEHDINLLLPLALVLLLIGYFLSFRTAKGVILPFCVVVISIIWTMGLMGHLGFPITVVSSIVPVVMIAVSSSYGIHVVHRYYEEAVNDISGKVAAKRAIEKIGPALIMTGITSALGSATLIIFKVTSIQEFGVAVALGILCTLTISMFFIPAILSLLKNKVRNKAESANLDEKVNNKKGDIFDRVLLKMADISINQKEKVVGITVLLLLISLFGMTKIRIGTDFIKYFPENHRLTTSFEKFNEKLGGVRSLNIMIDGKSTDMVKNPDFLKKIVAFQEFAESQEGVGYSDSFADVIKKINKEIEGDQAFYKIPDSQNTIAQYLLLYSMSGDPEDFENLVDYDYQRAKIKLFLTTSEQEDHLQLYNTFKDYTESNFGENVRVEYGGDVMFWLAQVRYIVTGKIQNIILAVFVVLLFCIIVFRSISAGLLSIIPLTISSIFTFGIMGFLGIRLETGTAIITAIGIGIGVDFAIHYLLRFQKEVEANGSLEEAADATILTS